MRLADGTTPGSCPQNRDVTRTWTAKDHCGNSSTASQVIHLVDTTAPQLQNVPADTTAECSAIPAPPTVTATDNCDPAPKVTMTEVSAPGAVVGQYTLTRTWTAKDACGNTSSASQVITVDDNTSPVLVGVPANTTVECNAIPPAAVVTATDNCDPNVKVSFNEVIIAGNCPGNYTIKRTWTTTDASGNTVSATQTIIVHDTTKPILHNVPADGTAERGNLTPAAG